MTLNEIMELLTQAKELGVCELQLDNLKVSFYEPNRVLPTELPVPLNTATSPDSNQPVHETSNLSEKDIKELMKKLMPPEPTPEEVLYYSSPYYEQLQMEKQAHEQKLREEGYGHQG